MACQIVRDGVTEFDARDAEEWSGGEDRQAVDALHSAKMRQFRATISADLFRSSTGASIWQVANNGTRAFYNKAELWSPDTRRVVVSLGSTQAIILYRS